MLAIPCYHQSYSKKACCCVVHPAANEANVGVVRSCTCLSSSQAPLTHHWGSPPFLHSKEALLASRLCVLTDTCVRPLSSTGLTVPGTDVALVSRALA
jgi:hypothetical protein